MQNHSKNVFKEIIRLIALEKRPFTLNDHYYTSKRNIYLENFKKPLAGLGNGSTYIMEYEQELIVMAECEAYYRVAYKVGSKSYQP